MGSYRVSRANKSYQHVSLFSGIGGIDLAAEWAGFTTALQVEMDDYATKVLEKHWPDVSRRRDVREVTRKEVKGEITLLSGGFPCQPFSSAGKRGGRGDDRYLWPEMLRVVRELKPRFVLGENVSGLISLDEGMEIESIIADLENENYSVWTGVIPAAGVGAPHRRDRIFIVGYSESNDKRRQRERSGRQPVKTGRSGAQSDDVADTASERRLTRAVSGGKVSEKTGRAEPHKRSQSPTAGEWWAAESRICRVANGVPRRMERLKCLGNAVVPQQIYPVLRALMEYIKSV